MADLADASLWAPVRQIETTDPVVGGPPNLVTGAGMSNIPHQLLANRTKFLRDQLDGAGTGLDVVSTVTNFDTITKTGTYYASSGATGAPIAASVFTVQHSAGNVVNTAMQMATLLTGDRTFFRRKTGGTWQAWSELWTGVQATNSLLASGWQRLPSGLILQWGNTGSKANGDSVSFPIAFPNNLFSIALADTAASTAASASHIVSHLNATTSGFTVVITRDDGSQASSTSSTFIAIGN